MAAGDPQVKVRQVSPAAGLMQKLKKNPWTRRSATRKKDIDRQAMAKVLPGK